MKNVFKVNLIAVTCALMVGCAKTTDQAGGIPEVAFEEAAPGFRISDSFSNVKAFQLELNDTCVIDEVRQIIKADDNTLIVLAKNEIFTFDKDNGKFIKKIGGIGEGPEEYLNITALYFNRNDRTVNIIDTYAGKMVRYGLSGNLVSKEKIDLPGPWINAIAHSDDGYMMINYLFTGGSLQPPSKYAFSVVEPNGEFEYIDPFAPVTLDGSYASEFASKPFTVVGDRFTFFKFLNDTIFTMEKGNIAPAYRLSLKKKLPQKYVVAQSGDYFRAMLSMGGDYAGGFNKIFETSKFIVLESFFLHRDGYFWIDKNALKGTHISSMSVEMMLKGESIPYLKGSNENTLISAFELAAIDTAKECLSEDPEMVCFNDEVRTVFENADPEGNPVVIIYEH